ncbi:MAG TPA: ABC transporter ATP-binding protein [Thermoanaerobaculia bacterium]|nr:ABC transporter ATP-binding protein [Thermoanaerobaculia bacterium]
MAATEALNGNDTDAGPLIRFVGLSKRYGEGKRERTVLDDVDGEIAAGELVVLLGRSGSGKSTLLNLVSGIDLPSAGEVFVAGRSIGRLSERERTLFRRDHVGFVFQFYNLIPTLTVEENLLLPLELQGRADAAGRRRAGELLAEVGLADRADDFPDRLSGGEQQRVAVARALAHDPLLVLADEPTGNLDLETGLAVLDLLDRLTRQAGKTLLMVTHGREVIGIADRILTIEDGKLVERQRTAGGEAATPVTG